MSLIVVFGDSSLKVETKIDDRRSSGINNIQGYE